MVLACIALWLPPLGQLMVLKRRLMVRIEAGPRAFDFRLWLGTALPILMAESFYLLLAHTDVLMLQQFRPPNDVAVYYAAVKTLAFVSFISFSIAATTAHRCRAYHDAGDTQGLNVFLGQVIRWTFWPSLVVTLALLALGRQLLSLFGPNFGEGEHLMFILAVGLVSRAAIGPMERFLNILGHQRACALVYASAFGINVGLCFLLIPHFGATGAAIAIATALIFETISLALVARRRLGFQVLAWGRRK
jgi:O-antigen/teichoic acid export membrane protein